MFNLAEKFGISPLEVLFWPANLFARARMWLSGRNHGERDRDENRKRDQNGGRKFWEEDE